MRRRRSSLDFGSVWGSFWGARASARPRANCRGSASGTRAAGGSSGASLSGCTGAFEAENECGGGVFMLVGRFGQRSRRESGAASLINDSGDWGQTGQAPGRPTSKCHCQARRGGLNRQQPLTRAAALDQEAKKAATARGPGATRSAPAATHSRAAAHFVQEPASRSRSTVSGRAPHQQETTPRSARGPGASPARPSTGTTTPTRHRPARHASPCMMM